MMVLTALFYNVVELINKNGLVITLEQTGSGENSKFKVYYSNVSTAPMENMNLLLAAPKVRE
jgi:hypothetical protein